MGRIVLILGGARSGKSSFALKDARGRGGKKLFIATAEAKDKEMAERIEKHRRERGDEWTTLEEPTGIAGAIRALPDDYRVVILDCLTLWLSNIMHRGMDTEYEAERLTDAIKEISGGDRRIYIISNEVGLGLVPDNPLSRSYRDALGRLNQRMAQIATDVYFMVAGIPVHIKAEYDDPLFMESIFNTMK